MSKTVQKRLSSKGGVSVLASVYVGLMFLLHPLVLHDGFFDITETKQVAFVVLTGLFLLCATVLGLCKRSWEFSLHKTDFPVLFLLFLYGLSCVFSGAFATSWVGADNRYQGLVSFSLYCLMFLMLSRASVSTKAFFAAAVSFAVVVVLAVLNHSGIDPLGTMDNLVPFDRGRYISTIGNINFFGAYICLLLPVFWGCWCQETCNTWRWLLFVLVLLGTFGAAASKSEGPVLGLGTAMLVMPFFMKYRPEALRRWPLLPVISVMGLQLFRLVCGGDELSELICLFLHPAITGVVFILGLAGFLWAKNQTESRLRYARRWYFYILIFNCIAVLILLLVMNTVLAKTELGFLSRFFVLDADWGTDRGKVWRACFVHWNNMPFWQKIIGGGSGCLARLDRFNPVFPDAILDAAHNELLHLLLTNGLLGVCLYVVLNVSVIIRAVRNGNSRAVALSLGLIGYLAQSCVNIAQPMTTPLFYMVLGLTASETSGKTKDF